MLSLALAVALLTHTAQGGFVFAPEAAAAQLVRLNPANNLGNIFSTAGLSRLLRSLVPFFAIATLAVSVLERDFPRIAHAARFDPPRTARAAGRAAL